MFGQLGQMFSLMRNLPKIKEEVEKLQSTIGQLTAEAEAGGGMVKVKVNGHTEVLRCEISEELMKTNDRELMEDLIRGAVNQAIKKVRMLVAEETSKMAGGLGLPAGVRASISGPIPLPCSRESAIRSTKRAVSESPWRTGPAPPRVAESSRSGCVASSLAVMRAPI